MLVPCTPGGEAPAAAPHLSRAARQHFFRDGCPQPRKRQPHLEQRRRRWRGFGIGEGKQLFRMCDTELRCGPNSAWLK